MLSGYGLNKRIKIETVIKWFRKDTEFIIKQNPSKCKIMRDEPIMEDDEVVDYNSVHAGDEEVRFITISLNGIIDQNKIGSIIKYSGHLLIAKWDSIIKKDDILIDENNKSFKVESVKAITHYGAKKDNCYIVEGKVKLIEEN